MSLGSSLLFARSLKLVLLFLSCSLFTRCLNVAESMLSVCKTRKSPESGSATFRNIQSRFVVMTFVMPGHTRLVSPRPISESLRIRFVHTVFWYVRRTPILSRLTLSTPSTTLTSVVNPRCFQTSVRGFCIVILIATIFLLLTKYVVCAKINSNHLPEKPYFRSAVSSSPDKLRSHTGRHGVESGLTCSSCL